MKSLPAKARRLDVALGLTPELLSRAATEGEAWITASLVSGPAVVLGAAQRAGRVVDLASCARAGVTVVRRSTAGTAFYVAERGLLFVLALPHVASLVPDATPRTLLNRNVRGFLKGLSRNGISATYFGREWVSSNKRPVAVLGFEATPGGAVAIEIFAGLDAPPSLPTSLAADEERALDRWLGKEPIALGGMTRREPLELAESVMEDMALRGGLSPSGESIEPIVARPIERDDDPLPEGFLRGPVRRVPIGWIDTAVHPVTLRVWVGGDMMAPEYLRRAISEGDREIENAPIEGASIADLLEAARPA